MGAGLSTEFLIKVSRPRINTIGNLIKDRRPKEHYIAAITIFGFVKMNTKTFFSLKILMWSNA